MPKIEYYNARFLVDTLNYKTHIAWALNETEKYFIITATWNTLNWKTLIDKDVMRESNLEMHWKMVLHDFMEDLVKYEILAC